MDDLPDKFDMIVVGTGMPECIIAAAAARVGKAVLHLDRYGHYGGNWASFNFDQLLNYLDEQKELLGVPPDCMMEASWLEQINDNERLILCPTTGASLFDIVQRTYIRDKRVTQNGSPSETAIPDDSPASCANIVDTVSNDSQPSVITAVESESTLPSDLSGQDLPIGSSGQELPSSSSNQELPSVIVPDESIPEVATETSDGISPSSNAEAASGESSANSASEDATNEYGQAENPQQEWTMDDLKENRRKFNLDLSPKLLFARGSLVELLITSNIARYAEFQCVNRVLTFINGHLEQVPCSRADVFSTKNVSVVEKRMLMKLLTFCMEYQKHPEEYRGFEGRPFIDFLKSRKVTPNIEHYVLHAIAMVDETCPTLQGLSSTQKFMESLGRYGNSPFLWSCFGSAELPQCFCRLCAVFGGIYYLKRDADAVILNAENKCVGIVTRGKKIECQSLIMEYTYAPRIYVPESTDTVSRAIYITDSSILPAERQQNTLLRLPPISGVRNVVTVLEFGSLSFICPDKLYVVHMICHSLHDSVEDDFKSAENDLFHYAEPDAGEEVANADLPKPRVLWCVYFRNKDTTAVDMNCKVPTNLFLTSSPGSEQDYENAVAQARDIFSKLYPEEEFLPRAPDPEDIIMEECSNPGDKDGFDEENLDLKDIENDVKSDEQKADQNETEPPVSSNVTETSPKPNESKESDIEGEN